MAYELGHNGTRPGGMTRATRRNSRAWRDSVMNDTSNSYLKLASMRIARRVARADLALEVAAALADRQASNSARR